MKEKFRVNDKQVEISKISSATMTAALDEFEKLRRRCRELFRMGMKEGIKKVALELGHDIDVTYTATHGLDPPSLLYSIAYVVFDGRPGFQWQLIETVGEDPDLVLIRCRPELNLMGAKLLI